MSRQDIGWGWSFLLHGLILIVFVWQWDPQPLTPVIATSPVLIKAQLVSGAALAEQKARKKAQELEQERVRQQAAKKEEERLKQEAWKLSQEKELAAKQLQEKEQEKKREEQRKEQQLREEQLKQEKIKQEKIKQEKIQKERARQEKEKREAEVAEALLQDMIAQEGLQEAWASELQKATQRIRQMVSDHWLRPLGIPSGLKCIVEVRLSRLGEVLEVRVVKSSGHPAYDRSAEVAVMKASPLPLPAEPELAKQLQHFQFTFSPEVL